MNFNKRVKSIFGYFWTELWKDSWLVLGLLTIYAKYLYPINIARLLNIYSQTSVRNIQLNSYTFPKRVMLDKDSKRHAMKQLLLLYIGNSDSALDNVGLSDSSLFVYNIKQMFLTPGKLKNSIINLTYSLADFYVLLEQLVTPIDLNTKNIKQTMFILGLLPSVCYQLWGLILTIDPVIDAYSAISQVPKDWAIKYPGAILDAWHMRQFGATLFRVKSLIGRVCLCPITLEDGTVTDISDSVVYINQHAYRCWNKDAIIVHKDQHVVKGQALCSFSLYDSDAVVKIYRGQTPSEEELPGIPVTTSAGIMYALNAIKSVSLNILPLTTDNFSVLAKYTLICRAKQASGFPYTQLPVSVNPMKYLIEQVWGKSCVIILIPSNNTKDLLKAFSCIVNNIPVGTICIVYKLNILQQPVLLNLTLKSLMLAYYQNSINNKMSKEILYGAD